MGRRLLVLACVLFCGPARMGISAPLVPDFCFLQVSDIHISPQPAGAPDPSPTDRSVENIGWFCQEARKPQRLGVDDLTTPAPAFVIATGDLTEYGVISRTWDNFLKYFQPLGLPLYLTPGNHDNTWTSMMQIMRQRHGGDHYSFREFGCYFACIDTATPQEPTPSLEQRTLTWLTNELARVGKDVPVFLFCHHPLSSPEFAGPYEQLRFLQTIKDNRVVLLLMGHGHRPVHERWGRLDSVMGGSTFGPNAGYNIISVMDNVLRVVYRFRDESKPPKLLLAKSLDREETASSLELVQPSPLAGPLTTATRAGLPVEAAVHGDPPTRVTARINTNESEAVELPGGGTETSRTYRAVLRTEQLLPGAQFVRVVAEFGDMRLEQAGAFLFAPAEAPFRESRVILGAGMKAQPLILSDSCIVATTSGDLTRIWFDDAGSGRSGLIHAAGAEILHPPAIRDDTLYFSCGNMTVYAVGLDGTVRWKCGVGACVYGTPVVTDEVVYVGDMEGFVQAIGRKSGRILWSRKHAVFSIEHPLRFHNGILYFGAWDGFVYAVDTRDGSLLWKQRSPAAQSGERRLMSRYFAAADCPALVVGNRLFVVDRAYHLGAYTLSGEYTGDVASGITAIGPGEDGSSFYARGSESGLYRFDVSGRQLWASPIPLGRFPIPPTEAGGKVYACSNRGLLYIVSAADGRTIAQYQATPQLHVMAPVAVDREGRAYVAGMDGSVTRVTYLLK